jgi:hypothetical protein
MEGDVGHIRPGVASKIPDFCFDCSPVAGLDVRLSKRSLGSAQRIPGHVCPHAHAHARNALRSILIQSSSHDAAPTSTATAKKFSAAGSRYQAWPSRFCGGHS